MEIFKSKFFQSILLELLKGTITFLIGFVSFLLFEKYRNKKNNNKLYVLFLRLIKEVRINKENLKQILNTYKELDNLNQKFMINNTDSNQLINLYSTVNSLNQYKCNDLTHDEHGNVDGIETKYYEKPHELIKDTGDQLDYIQNMCEYDSYEPDYEEEQYFKNTLNILHKMNIFDDFLKLQSKTEKFLDMKFGLKDSIIFLNSKLNTFNALATNSKTIYLDKFCNQILCEAENNIFIDSLKDFNKLNSLKKEFSCESEKSHVKLKNDLWTSLDTESIAIYDAELYIELESKYLKLNELNISKNNLDSINSAYQFLEKDLELILLMHLKKLKKRTKTSINI